MMGDRICPTEGGGGTSPKAPSTATGCMPEERRAEKCRVLVEEKFEKFRFLLKRVRKL